MMRRSGHAYVDAVCSLGLLALALAATLFFVRTPAMWIRDDGFYYLQIASNMARGAGSTFDGVNTTNGYQPLWLWMLVPALWLAGSTDAAMRIGILLQGTCAAFTLLAVYFSSRILLTRTAAFVAALLWLIFTVQESFKGMEFAVHALGVTATAWVYLRWFLRTGPVRPAFYLLLGLTLALTFLARLDTLALAAILGSILVRRTWGDAGRALRLAAFVAPILLAVGLYVLMSAWLFGHVLPISGVVKAAWSRQLLAADPVSREHGMWLAVAHNLSWIFWHFPQPHSIYLSVGTVGAGALWLALSIVPRGAVWAKPAQGIVQALAPFIAYGIFNWILFGSMLFGALSWSPWYYVVQPFVTALLMATAFDVVREWLSRYVSAGRRVMLQRVIGVIAVTRVMLVLVTLARALWLTEQGWLSGRILHPLYEGAQWARTHLPPDAVIGSWNAGTIGFLSERRTVDLDGVANSFEYFETASAALCPYWQQQGVTHLIDAFEDGRGRTVVPTYSTYAACANRLELMWSDTRYNAEWRLEVYRIRAE